MAGELQPDEAFAERFAELVPDEAARQSILTGLVATVGLDPTVGMPMDDPPGHVWYTFIQEAPAWSVPRMVVVYSFDDDNVYLHWIDEATSQPSLN